MMKCEVCEEYRIEEVINVVTAEFLGGEDKSKEVAICDDCHDRVLDMKEEQERHERIEHAKKYGRAIDIWEAENVE